jgi:uncharacterized membrane protein YphA (DoxX/SURF4 family)
MMPCFGAETIVFGARLFLASSFVLAGYSKLREPAAAARTVEFLIGHHAPRVTMVARTVGVLEFSLGMGLLVGRAIVVVSSIALAAVVSLSVVLLILIRRGYSEGCGCFGDEGSGAVGGPQVIRNAVLIAAAMMLSLRERQSECASVSLLSVSPSTIAACAGVIGVVALMYRLATEVQSYLIRQRRGLL